MAHDVTVLGSANLDVVLPVTGVPAPGETVLATGAVAYHPGGKGLNQAVAAARAGARTCFVGALGGDDAGDTLLGVLQRAGVGTDAVERRPDVASGTAWITVRADGENAIVVVPGANRGWGPLGPTACETVTSATLLLAQLEVDPDLVREAAGLARGAGVGVVLNAAPADPDAVRSLLPSVDLLVVNEHEAAALSGADDPRRAATLLAQGRRDVVVTLGAEGALLLQRDGAVHAVASPGVEAVDTTGAGDAFVGALVAAVAGGTALPGAVRRACAAGALAVLTHGAVPSLPTAQAVDDLLGRDERAEQP